MKEGQVDRTKEVLRMISTTVRYVAYTCITALWVEGAPCIKMCKRMAKVNLT